MALAAQCPPVYRCVGWRETLRRFHACAGRSGAGGVVAAIGRAVGAAIWPRVRMPIARSVPLQQTESVLRVLAAWCEHDFSGSAAGRSGHGRT